MSIGLLRIETRRSTALWLAPMMAALAWVIFHQQYARTFGVAWSGRSMAIRDVAQPVWPLVAGAAAWMAGRRTRRSMAELLATTPYPGWWRELSSWAGTVAWGVLVYLLIAAVILLATWSQATWGGPSLGPITVGLLALIASGALGYALGYVLPSRFTPPLVAIALFVTVQLIYNNQTWYSFLVPPAHGQLTVWGITPDLSAQQSLFLVGLTGVALGSLGLAVHRTLIPGSILLAGLLLATAGVTLIQRTVPQDSFGQPMALSELPLSHITPVCSHDPVSVCVHPAFQTQLRELSRTINRIVAPLAGLPGVRFRAFDDDIVVSPGQPILGAASSPRQKAQVRRDGLYVFDTIPSGVIVFDPLRAIHYPIEVAVALVIPGFMMGPPTEAQEAIAMWLAQRAGYNPDLSASNGILGISYTGVPAAERRFAALPATRQRVWLRAHLSALVRGAVSLSDLP